MTSESERIAGAIPAVRLRRIQEILEIQGSLTLHEAVQVLGVSEMTVRRDFVSLERLGVVERSWGGVVSRGSLVPEMAHNQRELIESEAKETIAALADDRIEEGETVFLSGGTTALALARRLARRSHLTIITTSLPALLTLVHNPDLIVIATGGRTSPYNNDLTGPQAQAALSGYRADKAVIGATGICADGIFNANLERSAIDRLMVEQAREALVVADRTKLGLSALALVTPLLPTMTLVTDVVVQPRVGKWLDVAGVRVVTPAPSSRRAALTSKRTRSGKSSRPTSQNDQLKKEI